MILSKSKSYGCKDPYKYDIRYRFKGCNVPSPLCMKLPNINAYAKYFDKNSKYMNFLVNEEKILKNILKYGIKF